MALAVVTATSVPAQAQEAPPPTVRAATVGDRHVIDGRLDESAWAGAERIDSFTQTDPRQGAPASARTTIRVLAGPAGLLIGTCGRCWIAGSCRRINY